MKKTSLQHVILPESCPAVSKSPCKPKSVVFTSRYLYTTKQQRFRLKGGKKGNDNQGFLTLDTNYAPEVSTITGGFPIRRSPTNPYKTRSSRGIQTVRERSFVFKVEDAMADHECAWKSCSQTLRTGCMCRGRNGSWLQGSSRKLTLQQEPRCRTKFNEGIESMKIDGWSTMPLLNLKDPFP